MSAPKFFDAIRDGDLSSVQALLGQEPSLLQALEEGVSPILVACYHKRTLVAEFLRQRTGHLTIYEAAAIGDMHQLADKVQANPELLATFSADGFTPLALSCYFGHEQCVTFLLENRADPDVQSKNAMNVSALHAAVANGNVMIVAHVLERKADPNLRQQGGNTALHAAAQSNGLEIARLLLKNNARPDIVNDLGKTPLDLAIAHASKEVEDLLRTQKVQS